MRSKNFKIYLQSSSEAMVDSKEGKTDAQTF